MTLILLLQLAVSHPRGHIGIQEVWRAVKVEWSGQNIVDDGEIDGVGCGNEQGECIIKMNVLHQDKGPGGNGWHQVQLEVPKQCRWRQIWWGMVGDGWRNKCSMLWLETSWNGCASWVPEVCMSRAAKVQFSSVQEPLKPNLNLNLNWTYMNWFTRFSSGSELVLNLNFKSKL